MKRKIVFLMLILLTMSAAVFASTELAAQEAEPASRAVSDGSLWKYLAAALAVGISCIAGGIAVGQIGSAAMGAMSENPELSGKALPYAGLAEGICLWGFLVALLILVI
ncbi:MAG: ATP synthase subunit C [Treponema sp.]|jgi:V/A-type H+-transporting ATPase subunit K|nr:ATP synthase subunit C [Treponema sp.]